MENTYWNDEGKYQDRVNELDDLMPSIGRTDNAYINLYTVASQLYYDVYNNGGWNIKDSYADDIEQYIKPFSENLKAINFKVTLNTIYKNLKNEEKLERFINEVVDFLNDKDLSYTKYSIYISSDKDEISYTKKDGFKEVSFGEKDRFESWVNHRINVFNYKLV